MMKTNNMEFSGINENVNFRKHFEFCIIFYVHGMQITKQDLRVMSNVIFSGMPTKNGCTK